MNNNHKPPWADIAESYRGVAEVAGPESNPQIVEFLRIASKGKIYPDETNWCSAFVVAVMVKSFFKPVFSLAARDWLKDKKNFSKLKNPVPWCIAVYDRADPNAPSWQAHIGFYIKSFHYSDMVYGGNQNNEVNETLISKDLLLGYLWPSNYIILKAIERTAKFRFKKQIADSLTLPIPKVDTIDTGVVFYHTPAFKKTWTIILESLKYVGFITAGVLQVVSGSGTKAIGKGMEGLIDLVDGESIADIEPENKSIVKVISDFIANIIKKLLSIFKRKED